MKSLALTKCKMRAKMYTKNYFDLVSKHSEYRLLTDLLGTAEYLVVLLCLEASVSLLLNSAGTMDKLLKINTCSFYFKDNTST